MESSKIMMFPEMGSNICSYYDIPEDGEEAAYLIGYLVLRMYKMFSKIIRLYV